MRALITGAAGFVGPYVAKALREGCGADLDIIATSKNGQPHPVLKQVLALDVLDPDAVRSFIASYRPTHVIHLAAMAVPRDAQANPEAAWRLHVTATLNIANAILDLTPECWLIYVSSGLVYGESAKIGLALNESTLLAPIDDYAVTKAAADLAVGALSHRGLKCLRLRPFNHTGPGQSEAFVVPAFAAQVARIEKGLAPPVIKVGNLDTERDFLDVRDVARAYAMAAKQADSITSHAIFNIASGVPRQTANILNWFIQNSRVSIKVEPDPARFRGSDLKCIIGDSSRLRETLAWAPEYSFEETLEAILLDCRRRLALQQPDVDC